MRHRTSNGFCEQPFRDSCDLPGPPAFTDGRTRPDREAKRLAVSRRLRAATNLLGRTEHSLGYESMLSSRRGFGAASALFGLTLRPRFICRVAIVFGLLALFLSAPAFADQSADYVIHISVDGLNASELEDLINNHPLEYDSFKRLIDEGVSTFNARTDYTYTNTLPNHTSMITGRPVSQPAGQGNTVQHDYTGNNDPSASDTLHNSGNPNVSYIASTFDVASDFGLSTALYASKTKFVIYEQSYDTSNGAPDTTRPNDGSDKIDTYVNKSTGSPSNASNMHADFLADMAASHFNYSWVHYRDPDSAGHASGWGNSDWDDAIKDVDNYIGDILSLIEGDVLLDGNTIIILTTDHGGTGNSHSSASTATNYTIPLFVWGNDVAVGADLYALNAGTRLYPGTDRPDYDAAVQPIRNGDSGNLALSVLGLPAVSGSTINSSQDLIVSASSTFDEGFESGFTAGATIGTHPDVNAGVTFFKSAEVKFPTSR